MHVSSLTGVILTILLFILLSVFVASKIQIDGAAVDLPNSVTNTTSALDWVIGNLW